MPNTRYDNPEPTMASGAGGNNDDYNRMRKSVERISRVLGMQNPLESSQPASSRRIDLANQNPNVHRFNDSHAHDRSVNISPVR